MDDSRDSGDGCAAIRRLAGRGAPMSCSEIERDILAAAHRLTDGGSHEFTAFMIARAIKAQKNARLLVPYSKVLNALESLQDRGMLKSRWADAAAPEDHSPRRLYHLTEAKP